MKLNRKILAILATGLVARIAIAPFTGQPYDMALWTYSSRLYFQTGILDARYFPTLPLVYYLQLASYSVYVLLRLIGLNDGLFLFHTSYMIEGLFLKLPLILADAATFLILAKYGRKVWYGSVFYLNPFVIFLSSAWGTYDSVMILFLVAGFVAVERGKNRLAGLFFIISGLAKLFGFVPLVFLIVYQLRKGHWRDAIAELGAGICLSGLLFAPVFVTGGLNGFFAGFVLRFAGAGAARTSSWSIISALQHSNTAAPSTLIWAVLGSTAVGFLLQSRRNFPLSTLMLRWSLIAAVFLNIFTQAEPQWLSWLIPIAVLYASFTRLESFARFSYFYGVAVTFLVITLTQGSGYVLTGVAIDFLGILEGYYNGLAVYALSVVSLMAMCVGFAFLKPPRFRWEIIAVTVVIYAQAFFWFTIVRV